MLCEPRFINTVFVFWHHPVLSVMLLKKLNINASTTATFLHLLLLLGLPLELFFALSATTSSTTTGAVWQLTLRGKKDAFLQSEWWINIKRRVKEKG